ncbi:MAG: hypothetical protein GC137_02905 [Alphaproteobacteria bacterium]|nr:hypothetical protein [Alphaproteobacteria bacterium]
MKRYLLLFFVLSFAMQVVSLSAYAFSCDMTASETQEMNCHEMVEKQAESKQKHCDGVCFCQHVMIGQHAVIQKADFLAFSVNSFTHIKSEDVFVFAHKTSPPFKPPIA